MSAAPDNNSACSDSEKYKVASGDSGDNTSNDEVSETKTEKTARTVRFPDEDSLVTQYFEPANPWQDVQCTTRAQLAADYLESCRRHSTPCIDSVLQQIRELPESSIGGAARAARLTLAECVLIGSAPADALEALLRKVQFRRLELDHVAVDDEGAEALFDMVEYYESANVVCISGPRQFGIRGWQAASRMIKKSAELSELEVCDSPLEASHAPVVARALKPLACRLRALCLHNVALAGEPLLCLVIALKSNSSIRELRLGDNRLSASDAAQLASLLRFNTRIQLLDLSNNQIQDAGVGHIADALVEQAAQTPPSAAASPLSPHHCLAVGGHESRGLAFLVLWNNQLTRNCAVHLSKALRSSQSLCVLNVGRNALGSEAVRALARGAALGSLGSLGLQAARLGPDAAAALADLIHADRQLQRLDLRENRLGVAGLQAILTALKDNTTLIQIDLDEPPESCMLSACGGEAGVARRLTLDIRALCRRNEDAARRDTHHKHALHRKISLTCHTACLLKSVGVEEERRTGRLRSPAPSPAPSPAGSPVPAAHASSRFSVTPVPGGSAPSTPTRPTCPSPSRFKVMQVMEPPQIQIHPATTNQPRKTSSRFSVTRNYDTLYNSPNAPSPPPEPSGIEPRTARHVDDNPPNKCTQKPSTTKMVVEVINQQPVTTKNMAVDKSVDIYNIQTAASSCVSSNVDDNNEVFKTQLSTAVFGHRNVDNIEFLSNTRSLQPELCNTNMVVETKHRNISMEEPILHTEPVVVVSKCSQPSATKNEFASTIIVPTSAVINHADKCVQVTMLQPVTTQLVVEQNYDKSIQVPSPQPCTKTMVFEHKFDNAEAYGCQPETAQNEPIVKIEPSTTVPVSAPGIKAATRSVTTQTYDSIAPGTFSKTSHIPVIFEPVVKPKNVPIYVTSDVNTQTESPETRKTRDFKTTSVSVQTDKLIISDHDVIVDCIKLVKSELSYSDVVKNELKNDNISQNTNNVTKYSTDSDVSTIIKNVETSTKIENTYTIHEMKDDVSEMRINEEGNMTIRKDEKLVKIESLTKVETIKVEETKDITEIKLSEKDKPPVVLPTKDENVVKSDETEDKLATKDKIIVESDELVVKRDETERKSDETIVKIDEPEAKRGETQVNLSIKRHSVVKTDETQVKLPTNDGPLVKINDPVAKTDETQVNLSTKDEFVAKIGETQVKRDEPKVTMQQIAAITEDLGNLIQEIKDLTNKNTKKDNLAPRDSILKKNKSESSLDSPDLEVSRLMNRRLIGSPFDSNSSLEISESSMESLNDKPTILEPVELDRRRICQLRSYESSVESASDVTPINSNLLNLSVSSNDSVSPIFGKNKKIHDSLSSLEASVCSLESAMQEKIMVTSADSGIEYSLQNPTENRDDNSSNEGTLTNNSSLKDTTKKSECHQLIDHQTSPKRTSSLLDMPALKSKGMDKMRKISWVAPSSSFHIPRQDDREIKPSHLEKLLSIFQHPTSIFSRSSSDDEKKCHTPPRKDSSLTSSFWSWGSTVDKDRDEDSENTDSTLSERVQVSFVDESFSKKLDSKTPSTDTDNTLSEFQSLPAQECDTVTQTTEDMIVQNVDISVDKDTIRPNEKIDLDVIRPRSFAAVLKASGSENSLDKQHSPDNGQPVDKLPSKVIRGIKENISPENTLTSSMTNALAVELSERRVKTWDATMKNEPKIDEVKTDLAPIATIEETCDENLQVEDVKKVEGIDLGKDALSYLIYDKQDYSATQQNLAQELKDAEIKEMLDLSPELVIEENLTIFSKDIGVRTSPVIPDRAKIKANSLEDLTQLQTVDKCSPKTKTIAFKVPESTTPRDIPRRSKLRTRSGSSPKSLPENLNKPCPLAKMESILIRKKKKVSSLGKMARDSLLALNMSEEEIAEFRKSYKLTSVESLRSLESVSEDANSQSGNSVDSRCKSCLRTSQESLMSLDSITEDCKCTDDCERPGKSGR